ncbi:MAG: hypothetical protein ACLUQ2_01070 [Klebsiella pneumoniae]
MTRSWRLQIKPSSRNWPRALAMVVRLTFRRRRQLALAGQARLQRQATIKDQQAERFRQLAP